MTGLDPQQFRLGVIRPVLRRMQLDGPAAEGLLLGTALVESGLRYLRQVGGGPALGVYQVEPATHFDLWRWVGRKARFQLALEREMSQAPRDEQLESNLAYATAVARLLYYRRPEPLPAAGDARGLATYYKNWFNTHLGKATIEGATPHFERAIAATVDRSGLRPLDRY